MKPRFPMLALAGFVSIVCSMNSQAASGTWTGNTDGSWADDTNWTATPVPGTGDAATFSGPSSNTLIGLAGGVTIGSILFDTASAASYTIGAGGVGSETLTLDNAGSISVGADVTTGQLFNSNLLLGNDGTAQTFNITNNSTNALLTFAGGISGSSGAGLKSLALGGAGNTTISGIIGNGAGGGSVALSKSGSGVLTLSGANTYSGGTSITGGVVSIAANGNLGDNLGGLTLNGGTLRTTAGMTNGRVITIGASGGTINNTSVGGTFILGAANNLAGSGNLTITGNGTISTAGVVVFGNANTYNGNVILQDGGIAEYANAGGVAVGGTFTVNNQGMLSANGVDIARSVTVENGGHLSFQNNNNGIFSGGITLNGATTVKMQDWWGATVRNGLISGQITGTGGLTANSGTGGGGILTLSGNNSYQGGTTINRAIVNVTHSSALGSGGVTINAGDGGQLRLQDGVNIANNLTINGGGVVGQGVLHLAAGNATFSGTINATALPTSGGTFATASNVNKLTIAGENTITSPVQVTVRNGYVVYGGAQNYTGGTTFNTNDSRSVLQFAKTASMPASGTVAVTQGNSIAVNAGGAGEFIGGSGTGAGTIGGLLGGLGGQGAPVTWAAGSSLGIDTSNAAGTVTFDNAFSTASNIGLIKLGAGTLELTNGGAYAGIGATTFPLVIRQGTLLLNGGTHAVTGEAVVGGNFGTVAGAAGHNARLQIDSGTLNISSWLSVGRGNGAGVATSDLVLNNAALVTAGNFSAGFNAGSALNLPKGTITLNGTSELRISNIVNLAESAGSNFTLNINDNSLFRQTANADQTRVGGADGAVGVINVNGGTATFERDLVLGYNGTGSGALVVNSGVVNVANSTKRWLILNNLGSSSGSVTVEDGGSLNLNTNTDIRFSTSAGAVGTSVVTLNGGEIVSYSGNGTGLGSGVVDLMQSGGSAANNTFHLNSGTLAVRQVLSSTNNGTRTFNFNGGTLKATGDTTAFFNLGTGNARANVRNGGVRIDTNGFNTSIAQTLLHSNIGGDNAVDGGLTKQGAGTLTLTGVSDYTGLTTIEQGTLKLGATGSINASSGVHLGTTGTFDVVDKVGGYTVARLTGSGDVLGSLTISTQLAIGNSTGVVDFTGDLTLDAISVSVFELEGGTNNADLANVTGSITLVDGASLDLVQLGAFTVGDKFTLFAYDGTITGTFDGLDDDSSFAAAGGSWTINYNDDSAGLNGGTGTSFVTVTAIPEPSVALLGLLGALGLLRRRR